MELRIEGGGGLRHYSKTVTKETSRSRAKESYLVLGNAWWGEEGVADLDIQTRMCLDKILAIDPCTSWWGTSGR